MLEVPARTGATSWLVQLLMHALSEPETNLGVGDGIAPPEYGWPEGQPGVGEFRPYVVVKETQAAPQPRNPQSLAHSQADAWLFPYMITGWGEVREQASWACDQANATLAGVDPRGISGDDAVVPGFTVQQIVVSPLGPTQRDDKSSPPTWSRSDVCTLWLARANPRRRG